MEVFEIDNLKRNPEALKKKIKVVDTVVKCTDDLFVMFPERFDKVKLAEFKTTISVISFYALIDTEGNYSSIQAPIFQTLTPREIRDVEVRGTVYKLLIFKKDDILVSNRVLLKSDDPLFDIFQEFIMNAKIPWYITYEELSNVIAESKKYTDNKIGSDTTGVEVFVAIMSRHPNKLKEHIRHTLTSPLDSTTKPIKYVGISDVFGLDNTGAKFIGGYWIDAMTDAINNHETTSSDLSKVLRS